MARGKAKGTQLVVVVFGLLGASEQLFPLCLLSQSGEQNVPTSSGYGLLVYSYPSLRISDKRSCFTDEALVS